MVENGGVDEITITTSYSESFPLEERDWDSLVSFCCVSVEIGRHMLTVVAAHGCSCGASCQCPAGQCNCPVC